MYNSFWNNIIFFFKQKAVLPRLIIINIAFFLLTLVVDRLVWLVSGQQTGLGFMAQWFAVPADLGALALKPWTVLTYMFLHEGFWHLFFNMLMLYFGGIIFKQYLSERKLLITYLVGGLFGALFFVMAYNVFPVFENSRLSAVALGASASVLAIIVAAATYMPSYRVNLLLVGSVQLKYLAIIFVAIDFLSIKSGNAGGHIAHLGGALWGFLYIVMMKNGFRFSEIKLFQRKPKMKVHYHNPTSRPVSDEQYNQNRADEQKQIDAILDKISKHGYSSLSKDEKDFLFRSSRKQ